MSPFTRPSKIAYFASLVLLMLAMAFSAIATSASSVVAGKPPTATPSGPTATPTVTNTPTPAATYYVDCSAATNGAGTQTSPWNNLTTVNARTFLPGETLLFKRATTCVGSFVLQSGGTSANRITVGAYGTGVQPAIDGTGQERAVKLINPDYVTLQDLEIKNSRTWGLLVTTNVSGHTTGLTLRNLTVHHVTGGNYVPKARKWTGLIVFAPGLITEPTDTTNGNYIKDTYFDTVLIDAVTAYDTTMWGGIFIWGVQIEGDHQWKADAQNVALRSRNITIQNSLVHDTYGDGITAYMSSNVLMQNNVVYRSGMEPPNPANPAGGSIGTPVALWYWAADHITAQFNEAYDNHSPGADGGAYDLDYYSSDGTYQYDYAHDNSAYCISVFGAGGSTTVNSIIRYNICAGNGTQATLVDGSTKEGAQELYFCTWDQGTIGGVQTYNNTIYITSPTGGLFGWCSGGTPKFTTDPRPFRNNLIVSTIANVLGNGLPTVPVQRDYNLYYYTGGTFTDPTPEAHGKYNQNPLVNSLGYHGTGMPTTQWTLQAGSPAINAGTNPCTGITGCTPGTRDFFGATTLPLGGAFDIGADEAQ